jgi:diguanylate cyclase (GGDEF)-like protein
LYAALMTYRQSASFPVLWDNLLIPGAVFFLTASAVAQLRRKLDNLSQIATRDFLTGLPNSQAFAEITARETERCKGVDPLTLVYIDLGGLDGINHTSGHSKGDQVLCAIGQVIKQNMPRQELIGRVGGTTFAVLLPKTGTETAKAAIWQLQTQLHEARRKILLPITFSISAMTCAKAPRTVAGLLHEAETRLRRSGGRDHDALDICHVDTVSALH